MVLVYNEAAETSISELLYKQYHFCNMTDSEFEQLMNITSLSLTRMIQALIKFV